jgi:hypothetical protein
VTVVVAAPSSSSPSSASSASADFPVHNSQTHHKKCITIKFSIFTKFNFAPVEGGTIERNVANDQKYNKNVNAVINILWLNAAKIGGAFNFQCEGRKYFFAHNKLLITCNAHHNRLGMHSVK